LKSVRNYIVLLSLIAGLLLFLAPIQNLPAWAQVQKVPHPAETIAVKGFLVSVDIEKGTVTVETKKGKRYATRVIKESMVHICDVYGCHMGKGGAALKGYRYNIPSGVPTVVEFDPKSGEVEMIDFQINSGHYLDTGLGGMDTEE